MRFLCASNLHLGRRISGLPEHAGLNPSQTSTSVVLNRLASAAVSSGVDVVLLAGDVIDRESGQFEPVGALQEALGLLQREEIPVVAIAGDEDFDALPRAIAALGSAIPGDAITVLGADRPSINISRGGDHATVIGVSQPGQAELENVLATIPEVQTPYPRIIMLHGSLTDGYAPDRTFQPVRANDLAASRTDIWVLGAQREPDVVVLDATTVIETGAAAPFHVEETGMHGATLVELLDDGQVVCDMVPLSPVQFEDIDLDVTVLGTLEEIEGAIVGALHATLDDAVAGDALGSLAAVLCPVHLIGTTSLHAELPAFTDELARSLAVERQGVVAAIESVEIDTHPDVDLDALIGRPDPVGELARLLRVLDDEAAPTPAQDALVRRATDRLVGVHRSRIFAATAHDREPDAGMARMYLRREAWNVLDALVRQRGVD